jgi:formylglycine-generating enzyme required for sulfatase activity
MFGLLILVSAITIGCGGDNENPVVPQVGAITINPEPNSIGAPWQITGPNAFSRSGSGDATLTEMTAGTYTLTWGTAAGWTTPSPAAATQTLAASGTLTFTGTYVAQASTITINPEPDSISAPWQIAGPNEFTLSANGDTTLADMAAGIYTLTWESVAGWTTPSPAAETQTLVASGALTFSGTYVVQAGTITINPEPNSINAPWQITGPNDFTLPAHGDTTLANMTAGIYTLTWGSVAGWTAPSPATVTQTLALGGVVTFAGLYIVIPNEPVYVSIAAGTFTMGSPTTEPGRYYTETQHQVTLTHGIDVQTTEVTNEQYRAMAQWAYDNGYARVSISLSDTLLVDLLDGSTQVLKYLGASTIPKFEISFRGSLFSCVNPTHPVKFVTWYGSVAYCDWLSLQQGLPRAYSHSTWQCNSGNPYTATGYRLPTEAEWEYACRAGSTTAFANGAITATLIDPNLALMGWYYGNTGSWWSHPVAQKLPNAWGLYDMHGNEWEWCNDWYGTYGGDVTDPVGPAAGTYRVVRGGSWGSFAQYCRSAFRIDGHPPVKTYLENIGFRPVKLTD